MLLLLLVVAAVGDSLLHLHVLRPPPATAHKRRAAAMSFFVRSFRSTVRTSVARRCMSDQFKDRERAAEAAFFNQEDAAKLAALQAKLRVTAAQQGNAVVQKVRTTETDKLVSLIAPHKLPRETLQRACVRACMRACVRWACLRVVGVRACGGRVCVPCVCVRRCVGCAVLLACTV